MVSLSIQLCIFTKHNFISLSLPPLYLICLRLAQEGNQETQTQMARSHKLCILRKSGKQDPSGLESSTKLSDLDYSQKDNITNGNTYGLQPYPIILTSLVWHVLLVQPCSATSFLTLATVTGILEPETQTANQDKPVKS